MADGAAFCSACGQMFSTTAPARSPMLSAPAALAAPQLPHAGFWLRFLAYLIDSVVIGLGVVVVLVPLIFLTGLGTLLTRLRPQDELGDAGFFLIIGVLFLFATVSLAVTWLYHAWMESSEWQATVGKKALGIIVTDMAGHRVSFERATGRHFAKIVTNMVPAFIGYIMAGFTEKKQALHDMIASCLILRQSH